MTFEEWAEVIRTQVADGRLSPADAIAVIAIVIQFDQLLAELTAESAAYQAIGTSNASRDVRQALAVKHEHLKVLMARAMLIVQDAAR